MCYYLLSLLIIWNCSSQKTIDENNLRDIKMSKKGLPVGMVELSCVISEIIDLGEKKYCLAKVSEVHEYGNSVKALAEGIEYEFEIDKNLLINIDQSSILGQISRCRLIKLPGGMEINGPDKLKIVNIMNKYRIPK